MDAAAIAKWPNVPACYEWLSLDRRGDWRLRGERVTHPGLIDFLNRNYASDESGRYFVQNGPQRVFVDLAYTPWVLHRDGENLIAHTGQPWGPVQACWIDTEGNILLAGTPGIALLDDRDLAAWLGECRLSDGQPVAESAWLSLMAGDPCPVFWQTHRLHPIQASELADRYRFIALPRP